jgi:hypothetical protein
LAKGLRRFGALLRRRAPRLDVETQSETTKDAM